MSEMGMVERVARAISKTINDDEAYFNKPAILSMARAAIEAIEQEAVIVAPYGKVIWHGEGADEEFELVPTSRQQVYETVIAELKERLTASRTATP